MNRYRLLWTSYVNVRDVTPMGPWLKPGISDYMAETVAGFPGWSAVFEAPTADDARTRFEVLSGSEYVRLYDVIPLPPYDNPMDAKASA